MSCTHVFGLIIILLLWCLQSASVCRLLCFMFALQCHSTRLLQQHNDADCSSSMQRAGRMHDKGILFWWGNGHYRPGSVNAVKSAAHLQKWNNVGHCWRGEQANQSAWWTDKLAEMLFQCRVTASSVFCDMRDTFVSSKHIDKQNNKNKWLILKFCQQKCHNFFFFSALYNWKLNVFGFWTVDWTFEWALGHHGSNF